MPRPRIRRRLRFSPATTYFKPRGVPLSSLEEIEVFPDELEAVKLYDVDGLDQNKASVKMSVSQPTFARILKSARIKLASAVVYGKAIKILKKQK